MKNPLRRVFKTLAFILLAGVLLVIYSYFLAVQAGKWTLHDELADLPKASVGLVFGCSNKIGNKTNKYFEYRIDAATELWKAGKVQCLIVSGDNRSKYYNEPQKMKEALIQKGVPKEVIVCDFAGLRTLDSVIRAKKVFQSPDVIFVSQKFQNERASYIAKEIGLKAFGYNARDVGLHNGIKVKLREIGARVKMLLDVKVLKTQPRHLGEVVPLPLP